jgi:hypothetical protein
MKKYPYLAILIAWVLWIRTQGPAGDSWNALPGFKSREHCAANLKEKLAIWLQFKDAVISDNKVTFPGNNSSMTYICLTDDDDPRRKSSPVAPKRPIN